MSERIVQTLCIIALCGTIWIMLSCVEIANKREYSYPRYNKWNIVEIIQSNVK